MAPVIETEEVKLADIHGGGPRNFDPDDHGGGGDNDDSGGGPHYVPGAGLLAMRFVLASILALFVTIGIAYFERAQLPTNWQRIHVPNLLWLSTSLILASGWTLELARSALERRDSKRYVHWLELTVAIGLLFLASQLFALRQLVAQGIYLRHNPHSSLFYVLTGAHGLHLMGGIFALCYLFVRAGMRPAVVRSDFRRQRSRTAVSAMYWHFLALLWLGLFLVLLLAP